MVSPEQAIDALTPVFGGPHAGFRTLHAKGHFYKATFTATAEASVLSWAAHLQGTAVPTLVRLSNGSGHPRNRDAMPDVRGLAVSFELPDGKRTDIVAQTAPRFPVKTPEAFVELTRAAAQTHKKPWLLPMFLAKHPSAAPALLANAKVLAPPKSLATTTFYAIHAFKWTNADGQSRWVRYTWIPAAGTPAAEGRGGSSDYLFDELDARLAKGPVRFTLRLQLAGAGDDPHDPTSVWKSKEWTDAGTLEITGRDEEREAKDASGSIFVFDPNKLTDGIEASDDPILKFRSGAYSVSAKRRSGR